MLQDKIVFKAIMSVVQRGEREESTRQADVFVDPGIVTALINRNHQVLYGRRGSGKSHVFTVLERELRNAESFVVSIDLRKLGSVSKLGDAAIPLERRRFALCQDVLIWMVNSLSGDVLEFGDGAEGALRALDALGRIATEPLISELPETYSAEAAEKRESGRTLGLASSTKTAIGAEALARRARSSERKVKISGTIDSEEMIVFPDVSTALDEFFRHVPKKVYVLIDEWSAIPSDFQLYLADFIKGTLVPQRHVVVKIAALEQRSFFSQRIGTSVFGLELGAELGPNHTLDELYVYDRNPSKVVMLCGDILFEHLRAEIGEHISAQYGVRDGKSLVKAMFASSDAFVELVQSSEGVVRDLINVFTSAARNVGAYERDRIEYDDVVDAARSWYASTKRSELGAQLSNALAQIIDLVVMRGSSRYFFVPIELERHPTLDALFDARILHLVRRHFLDSADNQFYNIYEIDRAAFARMGQADERHGVAGFSIVDGFARPFGVAGIGFPRVVLTERALGADAEVFIVDDLDAIGFTVRPIGRRSEASGPITPMLPRTAASDRAEESEEASGASSDASDLAGSENEGYLDASP
jgi:hypothetical protein